MQCALRYRQCVVLMPMEGKNCGTSQPKRQAMQLMVAYTALPAVTTCRAW